MLLDASLRGGAVALLCLLAVNGLRDAGRAPVDRCSVAFDLCAIAYLIETAPGLRGSHDWWIAPARLLSMATPAVFLLWTEAAFTDPFAPRWWRWLPLGAMLALGGWAVASDAPVAWRACQGTALLLAALGIRQALAGRAADLVPARRRARLLFACGLGACIVATTLLGAAKAPAMPGVSVVLGLATAAALLRLRIERAADPPATSAPAFAPPAPPTPTTVKAAGDDGEDRALHGRLRVAMEEERAYRDEGLTVASLAARLAVPEHRLRRLVNQRLGHRNFVAFVNAYRLAEAMAALSDPAQARVPVLTVALDAGFGSIGPFNRAFKAHTGETPTAFRTRHLMREGAGAAG